MKVVGGWGISGCWWGMGVVGLGVRMGMETGWGMGMRVGDGNRSGVRSLLPYGPEIDARQSLPSPVLH